MEEEKWMNRGNEPESQSHDTITCSPYVCYPVSSSSSLLDINSNMFFVLLQTAVYRLRRA